MPGSRSPRRGCPAVYNGVAAHLSRARCCESLPWWLRSDACVPNSLLDLLEKGPGFINILLPLNADMVVLSMAPSVVPLSPSFATALRAFFSLREWTATDESMGITASPSLSTLAFFPYIRAAAPADRRLSGSSGFISGPSSRCASGQQRTRFVVGIECQVHVLEMVHEVLHHPQQRFSTSESSSEPASSTSTFS
ncbi:hypothetical protein EJ06DRAFT_69204 [Trichodelitschia bisporula]|uniref:Uncharacterized protein n=1 Tax=Trichodelitschia bisporula TaxID=703511 RepID=A0A6G1HSN3_9PEZI|nr:hypothetical protein EJ06DRAFT_69204 [Trichodelitschia bisporula]